jgi:hypothetical protein
MVVAECGEPCRAGLGDLAGRDIELRRSVGRGGPEAGAVRDDPEMAARRA